MNTKDFINIISQPVQIKNEQIFELEEVIQRFPYFQTARVLHLKALKNQKSNRYNQNLRTTAAYTSDRSVLFHYITSDIFSDTDLNNQELDIITEIEVVDERVIRNLDNDQIIDKTSDEENTQTPKDYYSLKAENSEISPLDIELKNLNIISISEDLNDFDTEIEEDPIDSVGNYEDSEEIPENTDSIEIEDNLLIKENPIDSVVNYKDPEEVLENTDSIEIENTIPDDPGLIQEMKTSFELDKEQRIEPEIHKEDIEIYIESYSGQLDKDEIRALLDSYKAKSDAEKLDLDNTKNETVLNFELPKEDIKEQVDQTEFETAPQITKKNGDDVDIITIHPKTPESNIVATNPLGSVFEIDSQEAIETLVDIDIDENTSNLTQITNTSFELRFEPITERIESEVSQKEIPESKIFPIEEKEEEIEIVSEPVSFDKDDTHSFNDWLQLSSFKPIDRNESTTKGVKKEKNKELIDIFIDNNPKITPIKSSTSSTSIQLDQEDSTEKQTMMTETLAQIYTNQKKYKNAIKAYEVLSLKFPEKSGFFADQIKMLKKLKQE